MSYDAVTLPATCGICDYLTYDPHSVNGMLVCPTCAKELNDAEFCVCGRMTDCPSCAENSAKCYCTDEHGNRDCAAHGGGHAIECPRCQVELGDGRFQCQRAKDSALCMDCALGIDPPTDEPYELTENDL